MGIFSTLFDENERNVRKLKKIADNLRLCPTKSCKRLRRH